MAAACSTIAPRRTWRDASPPSPKRTKRPRRDSDQDPERSLCLRGTIDTSDRSGRQDDSGFFPAADHRRVTKHSRDRRHTPSLQFRCGGRGRCRRGGSERHLSAGGTLAGRGRHRRSRLARRSARRRSLSRHRMVEHPTIEQVVSARRHRSLAAATNGNQRDHEHGQPTKASVSMRGAREFDQLNLQDKKPFGY